MEYDVKTAKRIAYFGARKMTDQGYTYFPDSIEGFYVVVTPTGRGYFVNPDREMQAGGFGPCTCAFSKENGICKHFYWLAHQVEQDAKDAARAEAEAEGEWIIREEAGDLLEQF